VALLALVAAGCGPDLPEPEAPGARVLQARCGGCHRVFPPASMTFAMWKLQVERMRPRFAERGVPWLTSPEEQSLLDYLARHAGGS
jgi:hypothetical protein